MTPPTARAVSEVLEAAADLLTPEGAWTQGAGSRDRTGVPLGDHRPRNPKAVCWCMGGALYYVSELPVPHSDVEILLNQFLGVDFVKWNDAPERTQAEVVAALRSAATLARETEARS